ncbi:hypothetical protein FHS27_003636 [Rhodopirellula rubra]|uniref:Uncharacterized protein n=1 Tax=Aporhodopirellula rubra TaxID=980271 RepID=A0A7W5E077_9BACT|nr:hypothetical protein [Aporhodopirellula rubra]
MQMTSVVKGSYLQRDKLAHCFSLSTPTTGWLAQPVCSLRQLLHSA